MKDLSKYIDTDAASESDFRKNEISKACDYRP